MVLSFYRYLQRTVVFVLTIVLRTVHAGECRDWISIGRLPPRSDAECAQYDAGVKRQ